MVPYLVALRGNTVEEAGVRRVRGRVVARVVLARVRRRKRCILFFSELSLLFSSDGVDIDIH